MDSSTGSPTESFVRRCEPSDALSPLYTPKCPVAARKLLIIYCGGTMGMKWVEGGGYVPVSGYLFHILSRLPYFHDPDLLLRWDFGQEHSSLLTPFMMVPPSSSGPSIAYSILEHPTLLDSSNMGMSDWIQIASEIETWYDLFDAFVIIHGTDTLAYTASALSFLLESLGKPVVLTGSQIPFSELRNDATDNLLGAMTMAAHLPHLSEVTVYFGRRLFRGNRSCKVSNEALTAFDSPNFPPLAEAGIRITPTTTCPNTCTMSQQYSLSRSNLLVHRHLDPNVAVLRIFPGISTEAFRALLAAPIRGVVLTTFGSGNMPNNRPDLLEALREAISDRQVIVVNVSQCAKGAVHDKASYATGRTLDKLGVVPGSDMTVECALTKLTFLLGQPLPPHHIKSLLKRSLRGELSEPARDRVRHDLLEAVTSNDPIKLQSLLSDEVGREECGRMRPAPALGSFTLLHLARYLGFVGCAELISRASPYLEYIKDHSGRTPGLIPEGSGE